MPQVTSSDLSFGRWVWVVGWVGGLVSGVRRSRRDVQWVVQAGDAEPTHP